LGNIDDTNNIENIPTEEYKEKFTNINKYEPLLDKSNLEVIYDFGEYVEGNQPTINNDSLCDIISDCTKKMNLLNNEIKDLSEEDKEFWVIDNIVDSLKQIKGICIENNQDTLETSITVKITVSYYKACRDYEDYMNNKERGCD